MKKHLFQAATLLVAAMALFSGCDKADKVMEEPTGGLVQFVAKAATGDPETRLGYNESGNKMNYTWGELNTEKFSVFVLSTNAKHDFSLTNGAHSRNGTFSGSLPEGSTTTYAIYPSWRTDPATLTSMTHDLSSQGLYTTTDALYGNSKHLMWATAEANNGQVDYQFAHKTSMLKLELTFTGVTSKIKSVSILGAHNKANLNVTNGVLSYEDAGKGAITASDAVGFDLVDNVLTAYVYLFPEDLTSSVFTITAMDGNGNSYTSGTFNGRVLNAGTVYRLSKYMTEINYNYIVVGNLKWAKGNLVANGVNGAKIGAPEDGGLYFQFGSLVGWSGSGNLDGTGRGADNPLSLQVKPATCNITTWNNAWIGGNPTFDDPVNGIGDPCRYYLGTPWRLPTRAELNALFGQEPAFSGALSWGSATTTVGWSNEGDFLANSTNSYASHTSGLKFPASGLRENTNGMLFFVGEYGASWSASPLTDINGFLLYFNYAEVYPSVDVYQAYGLPVRCVRE